MRYVFEYDRVMTLKGNYLIGELFTFTQIL